VPRTLLLPVLLTLLAAGSARAQLDGVIDVHVHAAPDSMPRSIDALEIARLARRQGMRAILLKDHYTSTASTAYLVRQVVPGIEAFGAIALNAAVGGINPVAVANMARVTGGYARVVFMPTFDSEHYHLTSRPNPQHVPVSSNGELLPKVKEVLDLIVKEKLALATGHSSPAESLILIREARQRGIDRIIVTHPMNNLIRMSVEQQKQAAQMGAFLEYPYNLLLPENNFAIGDIARAIREVGPAACILTSDLGQPLSPVHTEGLKSFFDLLRQNGFTQAEIDRMSKRNPARLLGLE
jgi:hypothetical protein